MLRLFEGFGFELEYMVVNAETLAVLPVTDKILRAVAGEYALEVERGETAWSNELVLHVIEIKTHGPAQKIAPLAQLFHRDICAINDILAPLGGVLMPTAMHPWMNPATETRLWPHEQNEIYTLFDRIFGCKGHGWSNLQSVHINLPFGDDHEFGRLHAAIRLILPILPALAASSPLMDGRVTGLLDNRLEVYRNNAKKIPSISAKVIPEAIFSQKAYENQILSTIYQDLSPYDPTGILRHEWANARGAIARFDRNSIEIRILDIQECPQADFAIATTIIETLRALVDNNWIDYTKQQQWEVDPLYEILLASIVEGEKAVIQNRKYLDIFSFPGKGRCTIQELWQHLYETLAKNNRALMAPCQPFWKLYGQQGCLARRILKALNKRHDRDTLHGVYRRLTQCLSKNHFFTA